MYTTHVSISLALFFYKQRSFSTQPMCCLTFSWTGLQMLLRCCLMHITIIIQKYILYLVYLYPCLDIGLFMLYLWDLHFIFNLICTLINPITLFKQMCLFFVDTFYRTSPYFRRITWMKKAINFQIAKVQPRVLLSFCLIFCQFQPGLAYKSVVYKKACVSLERVLLLEPTNHIYSRVLCPVLMQGAQLRPLICRWKYSFQVPPSNFFYRLRRKRTDFNPISIIHWILSMQSTNRI